MELLDLNWEVFAGDPRLAEIWLPFNAHPGKHRKGGYARGTVLQRRGTILVLGGAGLFVPWLYKAKSNTYGTKEDTYANKYLVHLTTSCWFYVNIHVHVIHLWIWKILWILTQESTHFLGHEHRYCWFPKTLEMFQAEEKDSLRPEKDLAVCANTCKQGLGRVLDHAIV